MMQLILLPKPILIFSVIINFHNNIIFGIIVEILLSWEVKILQVSHLPQLVRVTWDTPSKECCRYCLDSYTWNMGD